MNSQQFTMQKAIQMIEVFKDLDEKDVRRILGICRAKNYPRDYKVYNNGDPSDEMIILLKGQMIVTTELGAVVGSLVNGMTVGEMGFFTGQPRRANVTTTVESSVLEIGKKDFFALFEESRSMQVKVLQNVVDLLSRRLIKTGHRVEDYSTKVQILEEETITTGESGDEEAPRESTP